MAKEVAGLIKLQIKGGAANPSPPVGPALGSKGINMQGQKLVILEAMKMENEIPAPKDGTVTEILVHKGDTLQEGDPIVTIA